VRGAIWAILKAGVPFDAGLGAAAVWSFDPSGTQAPIVGSSGPLKVIRPTVPPCVAIPDHHQRDRPARLPARGRVRSTTSPEPQSSFVTGSSMTSPQAGRAVVVRPSFVVRDTCLTAFVISSSTIGPSTAAVRRSSSRSTAGVMPSCSKSCASPVFRHKVSGQPRKSAGCLARALSSERSATQALASSYRRSHPSARVGRGTVQNSHGRRSWRRLRPGQPPASPTAPHQG
jgi:hypothetical protein